MLFTRKAILAGCLVLLFVSVAAVSAPAAVYKYKKEKRYREGLQRFRRWEESVNEQRKKLDTERSRFETSLLQQRLDASLAGLNRNFTIYLADNTPLYAFVEGFVKG